MFVLLSYKSNRLVLVKRLREKRKVFIHSTYCTKMDLSLRWIGTRLLFLTHRNIYPGKQLSEASSPVIRSASYRPHLISQFRIKRRRKLKDERMVEDPLRRNGFWRVTRQIFRLYSTVIVPLVIVQWCYYRKCVGTVVVNSIARPMTYSLEAGL